MNKNKFKVTVRKIKIKESGHIEFDLINQSKRVFVLRDDSEYVATKLFNCFNNAGFHIDDKVYHSIYKIYKIFFRDLIKVFQMNFSLIGDTEIHKYNAENVEDIVRKKLKVDDTAISLDPLIVTEFANLHVSRGFLKGGSVFKKLVGSPTYFQLNQQISLISKLVENKNVTLIEDDIFSGNSLASLISLLEKKGINVCKIIVGIQFGEPSRLTDLNIPTEHAVKYLVTEEEVDDRKVNLCDPGDFLLGGRGLVTEINANKYGRCPYIYPFMKSAHKAGIPEIQEYLFSKALIEINLTFFKKLEELFSRHILIKDLDMATADFLKSLKGIKNESRIIDILDKALGSLDRNMGLYDQYNLHGKIDGGEINQTYIGNRIKTNERVIVQSIKEFSTTQKDIESCEYLNPNKFKKQKLITDFLVKSGIPIPKVINLSKDYKWSVSEYNKGINLSTVYDKLKNTDKQKVIRSMAYTLSEIHKVNINDLPLEKITLYTEKRDISYLLNKLFLLKLISGEERSKIEDVIFNLSKYASKDKTIIHRDFFQRNIFVLPESLEISGVIDWADTSRVGDPWEDAILAAYWISDSLKNVEEFKYFMNEYNSNSQSQIDSQNYTKLLKLYKIIWYLELSLYEIFNKNNEQLNKHLYRLKDEIK